ncbi:phenylacetic acid degradation operon negative regulatory protein PaaX [Kutzneria viridogrisea]|uniref:Phenylacetic acid degradation operon negative regulatory protein n=1 Tax=Kutzneria viridogrisea TaxID=47990 RepID=A0ABR6BSX5_9PSEU|nr:phenylacetic acid degradation operon negative regulatory protein [Kutzneria viridogrisea]
MRARSAVFEVYGVHLRGRGAVGTIAALVRLLAPLGFNGPTVRTAVSRTVRQGWLVPVRLARGPGYALTPQAERRLDETAARIHRTRPSTWDGQWQVVVLADLAATDRERLLSSLRLLGYGQLGPVTWITPRPVVELTELLAGESVTARVFTGRHEGADAELAAGAWDLAPLAADYAGFLARWRPEVSAVDGSYPASAFATSLRLRHAWRKVLVRDPGLPRELLPSGWPGHAAAEFFDLHSERLAAPAVEFVDECLRG